MSDVTVLPRAVATGRKRMRWTPGLLVGIVALLVIVLSAIVLPPFLSEAANTVTTNTNQPISAEHWLGTDSLGRDWFARTIIATQLTLIMTTAAALISLVAGVIIGGGLWLSPRWLREPGLRVLEMVTAYPSLIFALIIATILGPGVIPIVIAIGLANTLTIARLSANLAASISQQDYVTQARLFGVPRPLLLSRHVLPNMAEPLLLVASSMFALTLMEISGLSFLGLGVQVPDYDLGRLLSDALPEIYTRPLSILGPALMISLIAFAAMLIGDGLAAIADPRAATALATAKRRRREVQPATPETAVEVEKLTITSGGGTTLVDGVSFRIGPGEILGLVGESGSGKSLTALAVAKLLPDGLSIDADRLSVGKLDMLGSPSPHDLARTVSLIYQDPGTTFTPVARIGAQLADPLVEHKKLSRSGARDRVVSALDKVRIVGPERVARRRPYELSGGMLQRAMIASAISMEPEVIIADEPTTALDVTVQREILRDLRAIATDRGTSMLFISHDIAVVEALCDRVVVMKDGRIVETVTSDQLRRGDVADDYTRALLQAVPAVRQTSKESDE